MPKIPLFENPPPPDLDAEIQPVIRPPGNLGISRSQMPQIDNDENFLDWLKSEYKITYSERYVMVKDIYGTQDEISSSKVLSMMKSGASALNKNPVIVSQEMHLLDGHHRWAALYNIDDRTEVLAYIVATTIYNLLKLSKEYKDVHYKGLGERTRSIRGAFFAALKG